jgi:nucleotide-binding universal stress UspA family protein
MSTNKLVVAVDFSEPSIEALKVAINLCRQLDGMLHIVYVADMDDKKGSGDETDDDQSIETRVLDDFKQQLEALVGKMTNGEPAFVTEVECGDPTEGIVEVATRVNAEMIVIGTHGRTGLEHLMVGSVAENVLRKATVPLICVRTKRNVTT